MEKDKDVNELHLARLIECGFWWLNLHPTEYDVAMTSSHREFFFTFIGMAVIGYALDHREAGQVTVLRELIEKIDSDPGYVSFPAQLGRFGVRPRILRWLESVSGEDDQIHVVVSNLRE